VDILANLKILYFRNSNYHDQQHHPISSASYGYDSQGIFYYSQQHSSPN